MTCLATQEGALMVQISRELFLSFLSTQPKALQVYLQKVCLVLHDVVQSHAT